MMESGDGDHYDQEELYEEDYNYQDWGVDRVDLDFKSGDNKNDYLSIIFL